MTEIIKSNQEVSVDFKKNLANIIEVLTKNADGDNIIENNGRACRKGSDKTFKIEHDFLPGIYLRRMILEEDAMVVSLIHKRIHGWFLLQGHITIVDENGQKEFKAPHYQVSSAGTQRVIYANEKCVFQNIFKNPTDTKDLNELEDYHYAYSAEDFEEYINKKIND